MDFSKESAITIQKAISHKQISAVEVAKSFLEITKKKDPNIHAFLSLDRKSVLQQAEKIDQKLAKGETLGSLAGVPIALKDNLCIKGEITTCASKILENYRAPYDATVVQKLKNADAILFGKTNLDEFAMGSSTENSAMGRTSNPWNKEYVPGGSSGGSAAAVAAEMVPLALGSDTGGSIRQPAAFCGVMGLKPTYGRVSRYGLVAFASSLDQVGPFARTSKDMALLLQVIAGTDPMDSTCSKEPVPNYQKEMTEPLSGMKIGLPKEFFTHDLESETKEKILDTVKKYESLGAKVQEVSLPHTKYSVSIYYILAPSEASSNLSRYDGVRFGWRSKEGNSLLDMYKKSRGKGLGSEVKRRIMLGTYALSAGFYDAYYAKAQKVRTLMCQDFEKAFQQVDVLLTPTTPSPAFKAGEKVSDPLQMYLSDIFTIAANIVGIPAISVPIGFSKNQLPIGVQFMAPPFQESRLFQYIKPIEKNST